MVRSTVANISDERLGFAIISTDEIEVEGPAAVERMHARLGDRSVYLSTDIDVFDPVHAPGTPEAGGLTSWELLRLLREFGKLNFIGADVVEVLPAYDHAQLTAVAASHVAYKIVCTMVKRVKLESSTLVGS